MEPLRPVFVVAPTLEAAEDLVTRAIASGIRIDAWFMYRRDKFLTAEKPKVLVEYVADLDDDTRELIAVRNGTVACLL